jgi:hypothetical protein
MMDLRYPGNERELVQFPSSDIDQTSSLPPSPNVFSQDEPDFRFPDSQSDWGPSDFDLPVDGNAEPIPADLDWDEQSVPADSTEFHPLINGMYIKYIIS